MDKTNQESAAFENLADVRARIDAVDDALLHSLIDRTGLIAAVATFKSQTGKPQGNAMRPGREAQMLRRLVARAENKAPPELILRIWRELIGWATQQQLSMTVHIHAPENNIAMWECARLHFGAFAGLELHDTIQDVMAALGRSPDDVAVLPAGATAAGAWLGPLMREISENAKIAGCLPLIGNEPVAYVLGAMEIEDTGDDRSLFYVAAELGQSKADVRAAFEQAGIEVASLVSSHDRQQEDGKTWLVTCHGHHKQIAVKLEELNGGAPINALQYIGGYPAPIEVGES